MALIRKSQMIQGGGGVIPSLVADAIIVGAEAGTTGKGAPKWKLSCEVIAPETIEWDGKSISPGGRKFTLHVITDPGDPNGLDSLSNKLALSGFDFKKFGPDASIGDVDVENPAAVRGHGFAIVIQGRPRYARETLTSAELAAGAREGKPLKDGQGKDIILSYDIEAGIGVTNIVGPSRVELPQLSF